MSGDHDLKRAVAAGAVDETNAVVSACLATGEPTGPVRRAVCSVQKGLQMISDTVREDREPSPELLEHLTEVVPEASRVWGPPASTATLMAPGHSMAGAMLRLARVVAQRARRDLDAVGGVNVAILEFMASLPGLLDALAEELDADEERSVPLGMCIQY